MGLKSQTRGPPLSRALWRVCSQACPAWRRVPRSCHRGLPAAPLASQLCLPALPPLLDLRRVCSVFSSCGWRDEFQSPERSGKGLPPLHISKINILSVLSGKNRSNPHVQSTSASAAAPQFLLHPFPLPCPLLIFNNCSLFSDQQFHF